MDSHNRNTFYSKEDQTQQISKSVFITNFPDHTRAKDLWELCNAYGSVVDVYIPFKKSKAGKRFAFIRFIKVNNFERLIQNLCTIWIGSFRLHANLVRFQKEHVHRVSPLNKETNSGTFKKNISKSSCMGNSRGSFASILKGGTQYQSFYAPSSPALVLDDSCLNEGDFSNSLMGQVKDASSIPNLYIILSKEGFHDTKFFYLGGLWVLVSFDSRITLEKFRNHVGIGSWLSSIKPACNLFVADERIIWVSIEGLPLNAWTFNTFSKIAAKWGKLVVWEDPKECQLSRKHICINTKVDVIINESFKIIIKGKVYWIRVKELDAWVSTFSMIRIIILLMALMNQMGDFMQENDLDEGNEPNSKSVDTPHSKDPFNIYELLQREKNNTPQPKISEPYHPPGFTPEGGNIRGSILDVMDDLIKVGQTMGYNIEGCLGHKDKKGWIRELCFLHKINFVALQETKIESIDLFSIKKLWGLCLDRHLSDHRSIIMFESKLDYDPVPFRMFHSWFKMDRFDKFVEVTWNSMQVTGPNALIYMKKKLQLLNRLLELDQVIDRGGGDDEVLKNRASLLNDLNDITSKEALDLSQKAKIRWSIEGDENSKFYHGVLNSKRSQLAIRGILREGDWIEEPSKVKSEFLNHFTNQFLKPSSPHIHVDFQFPNCLNLEQSEELERLISTEEVKNAVWDCGLNKSSGPDGFTFDFFRKYWNIIGQDIVAAVSQFFSNGNFPPGCNSTFITLIPKIHDAKVVKDFWPISIIGSIYKIIAKILSNRLSVVMPDLISEVQTAFISNPQILDGPFILNEHISWCKYKKIKAMIFKVDFEKAFDSVRVKEACLFKGIAINKSLMISHLFYADDEVFVGEWDISNIKTIVNVLNCFFMASGLKINLLKSKLSGIDIRKADSDLVASMVGCSTSSFPFHYLGVKVGASMSRISSWKEIIDKISSRLSKWKSKILSIGGRLTLLKSVLTALPLYYISLYKAPDAVRKKLEAIRRNFFIGADKSDRKMVWVRWDITLASKNNGGLGISSFYATNRALLFKWEDKWLGGSDLKLTHPRLFAMELDKGINVSDKLSHSSLTFSLRRFPRSGAEEEQYKNLAAITSDVILSQMQDRWYWSLNGSGDFSVNYVRNHIDDILLPKLDAPTRWVNLIPIKKSVLVRLSSTKERSYF
ncbi:RNA-directed DNA polymerase, eukaryota [Tanacetum coccineum]